MGGRTGKSGFSGNQGKAGGAGADKDIWGEGGKNAVSRDEFDAHIRSIESRTGVVDYADSIDNDLGGLLSRNWGKDPQDEVDINAKATQRNAYIIADEVAKTPFEGLGYYQVDDIYTATGMGSKRARGLTSSFIDRVAEMKGISHGQAYKEVRDKQNEALKKRKKLGTLFNGTVGKDKNLWRHLSGITDGPPKVYEQAEKLFSDYAGGKINQKGFIKQVKAMKDYRLGTYRNENTYNRIFGKGKVREYKNKYGERWMLEIAKED